MQDRVFTSEQLVRAPRDRVFGFFSDPANLDAITPPWLHFRIVDRSTPDIREGTILTYRLRIRGLPVTWRSRIEEWRPNDRFVDVQIQGPYAKWVHVHRFRDDPAGTVIDDEVRYRLPLGWLGHAVGGRMVAADVQRIFEHRKRRIEELLSARPGSREGAQPAPRTGGESLQP
jgi:ligand-binding SRPBCC domain-containing protein